MNMERQVSDGLRRLADFAPSFDGHREERPGAPGRSIVALVAVAAAIVAVVAGGVWLATSPSTPDHGGVVANDVSSSGSPQESSGHDLLLRAVAQWPQSEVVACREWTPSGQDEVVVVERLDEDCLSLAPFDSTTVLVAPYASSFFGESWTDVTRPWQSFQGHAVRRLASGTLMSISSRFIDAVACAECDRVIVVMGPDPSVVEALIESAH